MVALIFFLLTISSCWGSFLNVLAYRLMQEKGSLLGRSLCPCCGYQLRWRDLVPLISWLFLKGRCHYCKASISWLYPAIECLSALIFTFCFILLPSRYSFSYFLFFSALIVTIRTDLEYMLISQLVSLYLVPLGIALSLGGYLPLGPLESIFGSLCGYLGLYIVAFLFKACTGKEGLGIGDMELMACIGAFTGSQGCWTSIFIGSITGACAGITYGILTKKTTAKIPFGPFLALGAISHIFQHFWF